MHEHHQRYRLLAQSNRIRIASIFVAVGSSCLTKLRWLFSRKEKHCFAHNLQRFFGLKLGTHFGDLFLKQVFSQQMKAGFETLWEALFPGTTRWEGSLQLRQQIEELDATQKGKILVTAHLGSWDFVAHVVARNSSSPMHVLAKPARYQFADWLMNVARRRFGMQVLYSGRKSSLAAMIKRIKEGAWLGFVMDQKPSGRIGPMVDFFGQKTAFVAGPATLAQRSQLPVLSVFCVRIGRFHYRIISKILSTGQEPKMDVQSFTQQMASEIERVIRLYPEQWCWNYKRWRFDPNQDS